MESTTSTVQVPSGLVPQIAAFFRIIIEFERPVTRREIIRRMVQIANDGRRVQDFNMPFRRAEKKLCELNMIERTLLPREAKQKFDRYLYSVHPNYGKWKAHQVMRLEFKETFDGFPFSESDRASLLSNPAYLEQYEMICQYSKKSAERYLHFTHWRRSLPKDKSVQVQMFDCAC